MILTIDPTGNARCLYTEALPLALIGRCKIERASHVEPTDDGRWMADMSPVGGPMLGPYELRSTALANEVKYLEEHVLCQQN